MNLCDICIRTYSACMNEHENMPDIVYGKDDEGHEDAVNECSWFMGRVKNDKPLSQYESEKGEYYCKDCGWVLIKNGLCKHIGRE